MTALINRRSALLLSFALLFLRPLPATAEERFIDAPFDEQHWSFSGPDVRPSEVLDQKALRLQDGVATLKIANFETGIVQFDVILASEAPMYTGLRFHGRDKGNYEYFYLRAERSGMKNSTQYTPVFNGDQGWQIYSGPEFSSEEGFKRGDWNYVEARIYHDSADIYINGRRSLRISDLKTGERGGSLALSSSFGPRFPFNQVYYANFRYCIEDLPRPADMPQPVWNDSPGIVRQWQVSQPVELSTARSLALGREAGSISFTGLEAEKNGIANLARVAAQAGNKDSVVARFDINADRKGPRLVRFGYSDKVEIFVNGSPLFRGDAEFLSRDLQFLGTVGFKDAVALPLRKGTNRIAFVVQEGYGGWAAAAEFADPEGLTGGGLARKP